MSEEMEQQLKPWRDEIDDLDRRIVLLLNERMECALQIGKVKARFGVEVYDPDREEEVIANIRGASEGGSLSAGAIQRIFERIIDETRRTEREHRVEKK